MRLRTLIVGKRGVAIAPNLQRKAKYANVSIVSVPGARTDPRHATVKKMQER